MSMYSMLFGKNPFADVLLQALGTTPEAIPRFRDCFLNEEGKIVIHTRTGGGNRPYYDSPVSRIKDIGEDDPDQYGGPFNDDLRKLPGFVGDSDDDFDSTYADFVYEVPEAFKTMVHTLQTLGAGGNPAQRWQEMLNGLRDGDKSNPDVARAIEVGENLLKRIKDATDKT